MFRNTYNADETTWSPEGRLYAVAYSMEVVEHGSAAIGLRSKTHVVLACLKPANYSHQREIFKVDDDMGVAFAGLTPVCSCKQSRKRPYGVDVLVARADEYGAYLYYKCPSGNYFEYQAFAFGSRSQAAKTFLERKSENFSSSSRDDLIKDSLFAIRETLQGEKLTSSVCTIAVVGVGESFTILDQATVQALINKFEVAGEEAPVNEIDGNGGGAVVDEEAAPTDI